MKIAFFGDVVGRSGREAVKSHLPSLRAKLGLDAVIINAENAAGGFGITHSTAEELFDAGADVLTLGNHTFDQAQGISVIDNDPRIIRPCNYPKGTTPGRGAGLFDIKGYQLLVVNVLGSVFMDPLDNAFHAVDRELEAAPLGAVADAVLVGNARGTHPHRRTTRQSRSRVKLKSCPNRAFLFRFDEFAL